ncbi:phosphoglycerate kinase [Rhabdaerophilum calidifontis]|uniref:phosphoglycerate kinase n=1 Tax=Rhabdaerophilum calidifontis TaxID=2604328 RepID=UPI001239D927|nr:phosphoglycerate kinase [Rhabdaerophilum calidifontis]
MTTFRTLDDLEPKGKRVLVRVDLNVPMEDGRVTDATRLDRILPTLRDIAGRGGRVILLAHFGRPKGENFAERANPAESLAPVAAELARRLGQPVAFARNCVGEEAEAAVAALRDGEILCLENTRFHSGEEKNRPALVEAMAKLGDAYVNDAFSAAHRAHASTEGLAHALPAYAGRTMEAELKALDAALGNPKRPVMAIVGGAKVSTKLDLLGNLVTKVDCLVIGGGMANTFLAARGIPVGKSLCEHDLAETARAIKEKARISGCEILLPVDALLAKEFRAHADHRVGDVSHVLPDEMILDIGPKSVAAIESALDRMATLVWNGPVGAFELQPFDSGTVAIARKAANLTDAGRLVSVAGGGDTVAALNAAHAAEEMSYVSTAGGAFLEWMEGKDLPGVKALMK